MRRIDAEALSEKVKHALLDVDQATCETERQWASGYNAGLRWALKYISKAEVITPPPDAPLTLEELREMVGEIVYVTPLNYWVKVARCGLIYFGSSCPSTWKEISSGYGDTWLAYRRRPEEGI